MNVAAASNLHTAQQNCVTLSGATQFNNLESNIEVVSDNSRWSTIFRARILPDFADSCGVFEIMTIFEA